MGIGGGASSLTGAALDSPGFFLGGGGGGFFLPASAEATASALALLALASPGLACAGTCPRPARAPALSASPYFWLRLLADLTPAATWSPWRWRKLLAVLAAALASEKDTDEGSLWKDEAVLRAACFCAHVVPWLGGGGGAGDDADAGEEVPSLENRFCSSLTCAP